MCHRKVRRALTNVGPALVAVPISFGKPACRRAAALHSTASLRLDETTDTLNLEPAGVCQRLSMTRWRFPFRETPQSDLRPRPRVHSAACQRFIWTSACRRDLAGRQAGSRGSPTAGCGLLHACRSDFARMHWPQLDAGRSKVANRAILPHESPSTSLPRSAAGRLHRSRSVRLRDCARGSRVCRQTQHHFHSGRRSRLRRPRLHGRDRYQNAEY